MHFWERPAPNYAWNFDAWNLSGCRDVRDAIAWAQDNARRRRHQVFAIAGDNDEQTLVSLSGEDPNSDSVPCGTPT